VGKKKLYLSVIVAVNLLIAFLIIPYAQSTANSHMNAGPVFGILVYIISCIILMYAINLLLIHKELIVFLLLLVFTCTLIYWGYSLSHLQCTGCSTSG